MPPIPIPKTRTKARYSIVLMSESGTSRQIELTPLRVRVGLVAGAVAIGLVVLGILGTWGYLSGKRGATAINDTLEPKVQALQEELRKKELEIAIQEKRLRELQESPTLAAIPSRPAREAAPAAEATNDREPATESDGPLTALQDAVKPPPDSSGRSKGSGEAIEESPGTSSSAGLATRKPVASRPTESPLVRAGQSEGTSAQSPIVNFNARDVTAEVEGANRWKLSFRLVKDHPDTLFSGYVFVFVETVDPQGKRGIVVYPSSTRLAEEDLPVDYREGKAIAPPFRHNAKVALDYEGDQLESSLSRISILLYDESGKIVFQRGFDRKELKMVGKKSGTLEGARSKAGQKRRAL
jgi:hypothetical protein